MIENIMGLAHVALFTTDLDATISFYEKLGGACYARGQAQKPTGVNLLAMVRFYGFELEIVQPGDGSRVDPVGGVWPHLALEVKDLPAAVNKLKALGIDTFKSERPNVMPTLFGGLQNIFFTGPNGEMIELIEHFS